MLTKPYDEIRIQKRDLIDVGRVLHSNEQIKPYLMFSLQADELDWHEDKLTDEIVVKYKRNQLQYG